MGWNAKAAFLQFNQTYKQIFLDKISRFSYQHFADTQYIGQRIVMYSRSMANSRRIQNEYDLVMMWAQHFHEAPHYYKYPMELYFPHGVKLWRQFMVLRHAVILITPGVDLELM